MLEFFDIKFIENRDLLEDATVAHLRQIFDNWRRSPEAQAEQLHVTRPVYPSKTPCYLYCVRADADVLRSVARDAPQPPDDDYDGVGFVHLIKAGWKTGWTDGIPRDERFPPLEECEEEDVGWMKMASWLVGPTGYEGLMGDGAWYALYLRPPQVVLH